VDARHGFAWRRLLTASARDARRGRAALDALPPPRSTRGPAPARRRPGAARDRREDRAAALACATDAPRAVNLLIPTIDLAHFFGGYIGKFNLARRLARAACACGSSPSTRSRRCRATGGARRGLQRAARAVRRVEVAFGRESPGSRSAATTASIATTWWTAHIAATRCALGAERFLYLIQEYEPFTFPMGTRTAALAARRRATRSAHAVFRTSCCAIVTSAPPHRRLCRGGTGTPLRLVRQRDHGHRPAERGPSWPAGRRGGLLFYARRKRRGAQHVRGRLLALSRAVERGAFAAGWELHGIGSVRGGRRPDSAAAR
jgi:hypothetical protein